jgi:hypothetical protein
MMLEFEKKAIDQAIQWGWVRDNDDRHFPEWEIKGGYERHLADLFCSEWDAANRWDRDEFLTMMIVGWGDHLMDQRLTWQEAILSRINEIIENELETPV